MYIYILTDIVILYSIISIVTYMYIITMTSICNALILDYSGLLIFLQVSEEVAVVSEVVVEVAGSEVVEDLGGDNSGNSPSNIACTHHTVTCVLLVVILATHIVCFRDRLWLYWSSHNVFIHCYLSLSV